MSGKPGPRSEAQIVINKAHLEMARKALRCTGHKKTGEPCPNPAMKSCRKHKCYFHGGKSLKGVHSPMFKHGKTSSYMPKHLAEDYEAALNDPELLSLKSKIALLRTRQFELLRTMSEDEQPAWSETVAKCKELNLAIDNSEGLRVEEIAKELEVLAAVGADAAKAYQKNWKELRKLVQEEVKVTAAENKVREQLRQFVALDDLRAVILSIMHSIKQHVTDASAREKIQADVNRVLGLRAALSATPPAIIDMTPLEGTNEQT